MGTSAQLSLLVSAVVVATSCSGQDKMQMPNNRAGASTVLPAGQVKSTIPWVGSTPPLSGRIQISEYIRRVFQDRHGNMWFGTNNDGVCRYDGKSLVYFTPKEGFAGHAVRGITEDDHGNLWFATNGGASRYDGKSFTNFTQKDGLPDNEIWSILKDSRGNLWFGTMSGVCRYDGKSFAKFPLPAADVEHESRFNPNVVWSMIEDKHGNIWFGTDGGGARKYDGTSFTIYTDKDGLCDNNVRCILEDRTGHIWFGTRGSGVSRFDGKSFTTFTASATPAESGTFIEKDDLRSNFVWTMMEDNNGNIWFGTGGGGATRYNGKTFTTFTENNGLTKNHVQSIFQDRAGTIWFGFSGGLFRFDGASLINVTRQGPWK